MPNPPNLSAGFPLPRALRHQLETELDDDFSDVRIFHDHSATLLGVKSYTDGTNIYFAPGSYCPYSSSGRRLLAHELAHVVQQREGSPDEDEE